MRCGVDPAEIVYRPEDKFHDEDLEVRRIKFEYS